MAGDVANATGAGRGSKKSGRSGIGRKILVSGVVAVLTLALAGAVVEGVYRWRLSEREPSPGAFTQFDPVRGWVTIPFASSEEWGGVTHNSLGFRSPELEVEVPTITLLGDSVAWGFGVADEETVASRLAERLSDANLQVVNLGVPAYGVGQVYLHLLANIDRLPQPRWIIFMVCAGNDEENTACNFAYGKRKPLFVPDGDGITMVGTPISRGSLRNHLDSSPLTRWLWLNWGHTQGWLGRLLGDRCIDSTATEQVLRTLLGNMRAECDARGARFSVVPVPHRNMLIDDIERAEKWDQMIDDSGCERLDFRRWVMQQGVPPASVIVDNVHLSVEGSRLFADFLMAHGGETLDRGRDRG